MRRRTRRHLYAVPVPQAAPVAGREPSPSGSTRRGLVRRFTDRAVTRRVAALLDHPAAAPIVAAAVGVVVLAVAIGFLIGLALVAGESE